jgi:hypothetical protein
MQYVYFICQGPVTTQMRRIGNRTELLSVSSFVPYEALNSKDFYNLCAKTESSDLKELK